MYWALLIGCVWIVGTMFVGGYYRYLWHADPDNFGEASTGDWKLPKGTVANNSIFMLLWAGCVLSPRECFAEIALRRAVFWPFYVLALPFRFAWWVLCAIFLFASAGAGYFDSFLKWLATRPPPAPRKEKENPSYRDSAVL